MKLLKKIIAVFTFLFVFTLMAVNMRVNAAADGDYVWLPSNSGSYSSAVPADYQIFDFSSYSGTNKFTLQNAGELDNSLMPSSNTYTEATWDKEALVTGGNRTITINLAANQTASVDVYSYTTGDRTITIGSTSNGIKNEFKKISGSLDATHNTIVFSNNKLVVLEIDVTIATSSKTNEDLAADAIAAIGTVSYTVASKSLIDAATVKVDACSDTSLISNYSTYTAAVSTFDSLELTAISNFVTAVENIGTVSSSSEDDIDSAQAYFDVLFGDALTNDSVVSAKTNLDLAIEEYLDLMYDTYSKVVTFNNATNGDHTTDYQIGETIYTAICTSSKKMTIDTTRTSGDYTGAIKTNGASTFTKSSEARVIRFKTKTSGTLSFVAQAGGDSNTRVAALYKEGASSNTKVDGKTTTTTTTSFTIDIDSAGTYLLGAEGDGIWFYRIEFTPSTIADSATIYGNYSVGIATNDAEKYAVRFVGKIVGVEAEDITTIALTITGDKTINPTVSTVYTSLNIDGCEAADDTLYFYYSIYDLTSVYNGKTLTFNYTLTFADGSTKTLASDVSYTLNF